MFFSKAANYNKNLKINNTGAGLMLSAWLMDKGRRWYRSYFANLIPLCIAMQMLPSPLQNCQDRYPAGCRYCPPGSQAGALRDR